MKTIIIATIEIEFDHGPTAITEKQLKSVVRDGIRNGIPLYLEPKKGARIEDIRIEWKSPRPKRGVLQFTREQLNPHPGTFGAADQLPMSY